MNLSPPARPPRSRGRLRGVRRAAARAPRPEGPKFTRLSESSSKTGRASAASPGGSGPARGPLKPPLYVRDRARASVAVMSRVCRCYRGLASALHAASSLRPRRSIFGPRSKHWIRAGARITISTWQRARVQQARRTTHHTSHTAPHQPRRAQRAARARPTGRRRWPSSTRQSRRASRSGPTC